MKRIMTLVISTVMLIPATLAQDTFETSLGANVVNQYIWRGQKLGEASLQPTLGISYKGLSLTAWGSVGLSKFDDTQEFDLTLGYSLGKFNIGITDYWFNTSDNYFEYAAHKTAHVFEANLGYDFDLFQVQCYTNIGGADGFSKKGKRAYSTYVELAAPFKLGGCDWTASVGAVPFATTFYTDASGFAIVNASIKATKSIKITDSFSLPVFAGIACNPSDGKSYFNIGFTLVP